MAYFKEYKPGQDEDEDQAANPLTARAPAGPGPASGGGGSVSAAPKADASPSGGRFVGFAQRLNANKDVATREGNKLAGQVGGQAQAAQNGVYQASANFDSAVDASSPWMTPASAPEPYQNRNAPPTTQPGQGYGHDPMGGRSSGTRQTPGAPTASGQFGRLYQAVGMRAPNTPAMGSITPGTDIQGEIERSRQPSPVTSYDKSKDYSYTGPKSMTDQAGYSDVLGRTQDADRAVGALQTTGGVQAMLQKNGPATELDAELLGATSRNKFGALGKKYPGIEKMLTGEVARTGGRVADAKAAGLNANAARDAQPVGTVGGGVSAGANIPGYMDDGHHDSTPKTQEQIDGDALDAMVGYDANDNKALSPEEQRAFLDSQWNHLGRQQWMQQYSNTAEGRAYLDSIKKGKGYDDFMALSVPEATRRTGRVLSPIDGASNAIFGESIMDARTNAYEDGTSQTLWQPLVDLVNNQVGDSNFEKVKGVFSEMEQFVDSRQLYERLTQAELDTLGKMTNTHEIRAWLMKRAQELGLAPKSEQK